MTTQDQLKNNERRALTALVDWRACDKAALANKRDRDAQRLEYRSRNDLRDAADKLDGEKP